MDVSNSSTSGILRVEWPPRMERLEKASYKKQKPKFKEKIEDSDHRKEEEHFKLEYSL